MAYMEKAVTFKNSSYAGFEMMRLKKLVSIWFAISVLLMVISPACSSMDLIGQPRTNHISSGPMKHSSEILVAGGRLLYASKFSAVTTPVPVPGRASLEAAVGSLYRNEPLPVGYSFIETRGKIEVTSTGLVDNSNQTAEVLISVLDDVDDLVFAEVYLNGVSMGTATHANGKVSDIGGSSVATLSVTVPVGGGYQLKVYWEDLQSVDPITHVINL